MFLICFRFLKYVSGRADKVRDVEGLESHICAQALCANHRSSAFLHRLFGCKTRGVETNANVEI
jgi:hypothetical protein